MDDRREQAGLASITGCGDFDNQVCAGRLNLAHPVSIQTYDPQLRNSEVIQCFQWSVGITDRLGWLLAVGRAVVGHPPDTSCRASHQAEAVAEQRSQPVLLGSVLATASVGLRHPRHGNAEHLLEVVRSSRSTGIWDNVRRLAAALLHRASDKANRGIVGIGARGGEGITFGHLHDLRDAETRRLQLRAQCWTNSDRVTSGSSARPIVAASTSICCRAAAVPVAVAQLKLPATADEWLATKGQELDRRLAKRPEILDRRRETVEHPFGSIKRWMNQGAFLMRGLEKVRGEFDLTALAYNRRRLLNSERFLELMAAVQG